MGRKTCVFGNYGVRMQNESGQPMKSATHYSTETVAPADRIAYWREAVCESYVKLGCDTRQSRRFSGALDIRHFPNVAVSRVSGAAHSVVRRERDIRTDSNASFLLSVQLQHTSRVSQFGHTAVLQPGDMAIYDSTHPYQLDLSDGFSQTVLQFPKDRILARLPHAQLLGGIRVDGQCGIGKTVAQTIVQLSAQLDDGDTLLSGLLEDTLMDLIATGLASSLQRPVELSSPEQHLLMRARAFIGEHLHDPDLNRAQVARSVGLSVRRLNEVFAKHDTSITADIRQKRLLAVAADLADARFAGRSISEIALARGFSNLQHFSTLFKKFHQCSPKAYRSQHLNQ